MAETFFDAVRARFETPPIVPTFTANGAAEARTFAEVVQTFRSARHGRPEGLHYGCLSRMAPASAVATFSWPRAFMWSSSR